MKYRSTRSNETVTAIEALVKGLADDGGLYVPEVLPEPFLHADELKDMTYEELAAFVLSHFLTDIPEEELKKLTHSAYTGTFETEEIVPVKTISQAFSMAEMFHGRTCAFKDLALSLFPYLLVYAKKEEKDGKEILILTATSGDTGKAALEGFRDVPGVHIMVFYPSHGVSPLQKDQMQKQLGSNVKVVGIEGNFDDAQGTLKQVFGSSLRKEEAEKGVLFSSANSINIGRLFPQIVYYVSTYASLVESGCIDEGETFDVIVPTGNFGNILAGYFAKKMGIPIGKLVCASNANNVLTDFLQTGYYDRNRDFFKTITPSMDILISSNLERLLYHLTGDTSRVKGWMQELAAEGRYDVGEGMLQRLQNFFWADWADDAKTAATIKQVYETEHYIPDTHTAVAWAVARSYQHRTDDLRPMVVVSTASPYKFSDSVLRALDMGEEKQDPFVLLDKLASVNVNAIPKGLNALRQAAILHEGVCAKTGMPDAVAAFSQK